MLGTVWIPLGRALKVQNRPNRVNLGRCTHRERVQSEGLQLLKRIYNNTLHLGKPLRVLQVPRVPICPLHHRPPKHPTRHRVSVTPDTQLS
ncbi:hypothetical protein TorRG33x02_303700 [Trema orientale]|uniref:Uncharacterized protein n=1 Tax=Trema orientale TaxID=63057 RepID=A0A2P5BYY6_TREOI|nr:hypothetical protein TorRG33x02_303700 [Trema orientale]